MSMVALPLFGRVASGGKSHQHLCCRAHENPFFDLILHPSINPPPLLSECETSWIVTVLSPLGQRDKVDQTCTRVYYIRLG